MRTQALERKGKREGRGGISQTFEGKIHLVQMQKIGRREEGGMTAGLTHGVCESPKVIISSTASGMCVVDAAVSGSRHGGIMGSLGPAPAAVGIGLKGGDMSPPSMSLPRYDCCWRRCSRCHSASSSSSAAVSEG